MMRSLGLTMILASTVLSAQEQAADQASEDQSTEVGALLRRPILDATIPLKEVQAYAESQLLPMPHVSTVQEWREYARSLRQQVLEQVVLRGKAQEWARQPCGSNGSTRSKGAPDT